MKVWVEQENNTCSDHAYGAKIIAFLQANPCQGLTRTLATTAVGGRPVAISRSALGFSDGTSPGYETAGQFDKLVSANGTGNISDLLREGFRFPGGPAALPYPNAFSAEAQDSGIELFEAWYLDGSTADNEPALETMEQDVTLQF